jgi:hypothetical protein
MIAGRGGPVPEFPPEFHPVPEFPPVTQVRSGAMEFSFLPWMHTASGVHTKKERL